MHVFPNPVTYYASNNTESCCKGDLPLRAPSEILLEILSQLICFKVSAVLQGKDIGM